MKPSHWVILIFALAMLSGCIRLVGKAGYVKETPEERTTKTMGFDTDELFPGQRTKGNVTV